MRRWGDPFAGNSQDSVGDINDVSHYVHGVDAEHFQVLGSQPGVAPFVPLRLISMAMTLAIDLNDEARSGAVKVEDVTAHRVLASELQSVETLALHP